jgi:4'-phosphopantetheinyl transferase EntD
MRPRRNRNYAALKTRRGLLSDFTHDAVRARLPPPCYISLVIETLLPDAAAVVEAFDDPPEAVLYPQERAVVDRAVDKRVREFTTVRHCARQALARLGVAPAPILPDPRGAPQWPKGVVGSMTHCDGYRAAVVARSADLASLGVDAEPHAPLPPDVLAVVSLPTERERLAQLAVRHPDVCWDRVLFCAKEAVYKVWYPLTGAWLDFEQAQIAFDQTTFHARLLVPGPFVGATRLSAFTGRWKVQDGLVFTAIAISATGTAL